MMLKFTPSCKNTNDEYFEPWGVTADPDGLFVVSDHHNHRLQVGLSKTNVVFLKVSYWNNLDVCQPDLRLMIVIFFVRFLITVVTFCTSLACEVKQTVRYGTQLECVWTKVAIFT